ncbi:hypothetical protein VPHD127_0114 [Vibrio phage D127]
MNETKYRNIVDTSVLVIVASDGMFDVTLEVLGSGARFTIQWSRFHQEYRKVQ